MEELVGRKSYWANVTQQVIEDLRKVASPPTIVKMLYCVAQTQTLMLMSSSHLDFPALGETKNSSFASVIGNQHAMQGKHRITKEERKALLFSIFPSVADLGLSTTELNKH